MTRGFYHQGVGDLVTVYGKLLRNEGIQKSKPSTFLTRRSLHFCCPSAPIGQRRKLSEPTPRSMSQSNARLRVGVISRHLQLDTTISVEILPVIEPLPKHSRRFSSSSKQATMSTQPEHPALLIPGPIEFDDAVLQSMSHFR